MFRIFFSMVGWSRLGLFNYLSVTTQNRVTHTPSPLPAHILCWDEDFLEYQINIVSPCVRSLDSETVSLSPQLVSLGFRPVS